MSAGSPHYLDYVSRGESSRAYTEYQRRYETRPRESDAVLIGLVADALDTRAPGAGTPRILDAGCSTGNLLRHLARAFPDAELWGGELMPEALEALRAAADLEGVRIERMDLLAIEQRDAFDVIVVNAVLYMFDDAQLATAMESVARALRPGGRVVIFDLFHPFAQHLTVNEVSPLHPEGHLLHLRPYDALRAAASAAGLGEIHAIPFEIPIDLPRADGDTGIGSHTVDRADGGRLLFRGALAQPWCHVVIARPA